MALTTQEIYDLCLIGGQWRLETVEKGDGFPLSGVVQALGEMGYMTLHEATAIVRRIAHRKRPWPEIRLIFDRHIKMCTLQPGKGAHEIFVDAIATSSKHLASLPSLNFRHITTPNPISFPLHLTVSGRAYVATIQPQYTTHHGFTQERFAIAFAAQRERAANKRRHGG